MTFGVIEHALGIYFHWETYVAAILYILISWIPLLVFTKISNSNINPTILISSPLILTPVFQTLAYYIYFTIMWPIIVGLKSDASWLLPINIINNQTLFFLKIFSIMLLTMFFSLLLQAIFREELLWLQSLLVGSELIYSITNFVLEKSHIPQNIQLDWWTMLLIIIIGFTVEEFGRRLLFYNIKKSRDPKVLMILAPFLSFFSFFPVFIYGALIGQKLGVLQ